MKTNTSRTWRSNSCSRVMWVATLLMGGGPSGFSVSAKLMEASSSSLTDTYSRLPQEQEQQYQLRRLADEEQPIPTDICEGGLRCFNGGKCLDGQESDLSFSVCDCNNARDITGEGDVIVRYVGKTCQTRVKSTDYCPGHKGLNRELFCLNGGTCRTTAQNYAEEPCKCVKGYKGRHCEYTPNDVPDECSLDCNGVGRCVHGTNPFSDNGANGILDLKHKGTEKYMYCQCDEFYAGTNCEYEYIKCDQKDTQRPHICFHGSTCLTVGEETLCQCEDATGKTVAGDSCEFHATDNCVTPGVPQFTIGVPDPERIIKKNELPFCVNNGKCVQYSEGPSDEFFCECNGTGWTGKRCESRLVNYADDEEYYDEDYSPAPSAWWTETWPPTEEASATEDPEEWSTPSPSPYRADDPDRVQEAARKSRGSGDSSGMSGFGKFAVALITFAAVFTLAVTAYRYYNKRRFGKEAGGANNLQLDMISEENNADGMSNVNLSNDELNLPKSTSTGYHDSTEVQVTDEKIV